MLPPYPNEFPREALLMAIDLAKGQTPAVNDAVHACWVVAGYALGQTLGGGPIITGSDPVENEVEVLEQALLHDSNSPAVQGLFPWVLVLKVVLNLIVKFADKL